ncbi:hypothetical protein HDU98_010112 [Podochytrium sp. JEL0797]|nr:hypothetical protein HDU98_010112 [Podochytrium sp. JEL0797]
MSISPVAHTATALATFVLLVKFYITIMIQGGARFRGGSRPPEDGIKLAHLAKQLNAGGVTQSFGIAPTTAQPDEKLAKAKLADIRWQRIVMNDVENIPIGLIVAWTSLVSCWSPFLHVVLVGLYTACRVSHTYFYANEMQPYRGHVWVLSVIVILCVSLNGVAGLLLSSSA